MEDFAKLFGSPARLKMLRLFTFNRDLQLTASEVADRAKIPLAVARKELSDLHAAGFLRKRGERAKAQFQTNPKFEQLTPLAQFIRDTTSVRPQRVRELLKKAGGLHLVVLSGLFTGAIEPRIDLLVVGDKLDERALTQSVHTIEAEIGREIRYASFATEDFRYRLGVYDRLLRDVFDYPHRTLLDKIGL